ncbi:MAG TPA: hypothetical protein PLM81_10465 [Ginsengibacter sp.]|nr:hypothetical protein [Ginsengibacter sp.]HUN01594.1 hypothetical protein [Niabella sp.]
MDKKIKNKLRWDPYVLLRNSEVSSFTTDHFAKDAGRKLLYIMGVGFDYRMNTGIQSLKTSCPDLNIECLLIQYDEGKSSSSKKYKPLVDANLTSLQAIVPLEKIQVRNIDLWTASGKKKQRVGDKNVADVFNDATIFEAYTDVIVDISALPRGIYFSLIGKVQAILDEYYADKDINFFVSISENAQLDSHIKEFEPDSELSYVFGFRGGSELTSDEKEIIWLPILGEGSGKQILAAHEKIDPDEICPVLPFPSRNPRRSDALLTEYHQLLFDELAVEGQNIIYVPEQNPFEVYRTLSVTIQDYNDTLAILNGCDIVISTFSSKLLSIGALLCAYEFKVLSNIKVGILNVDSSGYEIDDEPAAKKMCEKSELFLIWLAGEPYKP